MSSPAAMAEAASCTPIRGDSESADHDGMRVLLEEATKPQSTLIVLLGKTGSGKSTLATCICDQDVFPSNDGWEPDETVIGATRIEVNKDGTSVTILDTKGILDSSGAVLDDKTVKLIGKVITNDANGVIIVCISMFERFDFATMETLAFLQERFNEYNLWSRVVIALTKADAFNVNNWVTKKKPPDYKKSDNRFLVENFLSEVEQRKGMLKKIMTKEQGKFRISEEEFDQLLIPVIPTSNCFDDDSTKKMVRVEYGFWFDQLLIHCCQRERGGGIMQIHTDRLAVLPRKVFNQFLELKLDGIDGRSLKNFEECIAELRRAKNCALKDLGHVLASKWIWKCYCYHVNWPRFEKKLATKSEKK